MNLSLQYDNFQKMDTSAFLALVQENKIEKRYLLEAVEYFQKRLETEDDLLYSDYIHYFVFFHSLRNLLAGVYLFNLKKQTVVHSTSFLPDASNLLLQKILDAPGQESFQQEIKLSHFTLTLHCRFIDDLADSYAVCVLAAPHYFENSSIELIAKVVSKYYFTNEREIEERVNLLFHELNENIIQKIQPLLVQKIPITFTYFKFKNFNNYIELAGESFAAEMIGGLVNEIKQKLKNSDECYVLNPREYLIVSTSCEKELMEARFRKTIFQVKGLILNYRVNYYTHRTKLDNLSQIWAEITAH